MTVQTKNADTVRNLLKALPNGWTTAERVNNYGGGMSFSVRLKDANSFQVACDDRDRVRINYISTEPHHLGGYRSITKVLTKPASIERVIMEAVGAVETHVTNAMNRHVRENSQAAVSAMIETSEAHGIKRGEYGTSNFRRGELNVCETSIDAKVGIKRNDDETDEEFGTRGRLFLEALNAFMNAQELG